MCLVAYVIVLRPQNNGKKRLKSTLAEQKQQHVSAQRATQEQARIQLDKEIERLRNRVKDFVVDLDESTDLTFDISQIASRKNLASLSVTTRAKKRADKRGSAAKTKSGDSRIRENHIDIRFTAGFYQFATFVNALERHRPVLFVDKFKITRSTQDDSVYQVTLDVAALVTKMQGDETAGTSSATIFSASL
jgi:hypothetical protein